MADLNFKIAATLDAAGFTGAAASIRGVATATGEAATAMEGAAEAAETMNLAIGGFMGLQIVQFLKDIINETVNAEKNQQQLKLAVDNTGQSFDKNKNQINAFLEATMALTGANKEDLIPALDILIARFGSVRQAQESLNLVIGISRGLNMDYAAAAALVAGVVNGQPRALNAAARAMGLDNAAKKDSTLVLKELTSRYGDFSDKQSALTKTVADFSNQWTELKLNIGESIGPVIVILGDIVMRVFNYMIDSSKLVRNGFLAIGATIAQFILAPLALISPTAQKMYDTLEAGIKSFKAKAADAGKGMLEQFLPKGALVADGLENNFVAPHKAAYLKMNEAELKMIAEGNLAAAQGARDQLQYKLNLLDQEKDAQIKAAQEADNFSRLDPKNQQAILLAIDEETNQKRLTLQRAYDQQQGASEKALMDSKIALTRVGSQTNLDLRLQELEEEVKAQRQADADTIESAEERARAIQTINNNYAARKLQIIRDSQAQEVAFAEQAATAIGTSTGNMLAGQQNAWKSALAQIIQMIFNTAAKAIMANYAQGASSYVAAEGYVGIAIGAGLMALGAAAAAAINSSSSSPTSSTLPSVSVGAASIPSTVAPAATTQAASAQKPISVTIQGDMISDTAYIDRLAAALSSAVNNRDVRLVATQSKAAA